MEEPFTCPRLASFASRVVKVADDIARRNPCDRVVSDVFCIQDFRLASFTIALGFCQGSTLSLRGCYMCDAVNSNLQSLEPVLEIVLKRVMISKTERQRLYILSNRHRNFTKATLSDEQLGWQQKQSYRFKASIAITK